MDNNNSYNEEDVSLNNCYIKILKLKKEVFDANTVTFLVSFALALLFTTILSLQEKLLNQNTLLDRAIKKNFITKRNLELYTRIHCLYIISNSINDILTRSNYDINNQIISIVYVMNREILTMTKDLSNLANRDGYYILEADLIQVLQITQDTKRNIPISDISQYNKNNNTARYFTDLLNNIKKLENAIKVLPKVKQDESKL